jgi:hypothetical protein
VEELRAQGISEDKINAEIEEGYKAGTDKAPRKPGIVYMLSQENWVLADPAKRTIIHFGPHLMFYAPYATDKDIGNTQAPGAIPGVPFMVHPGRPDALIIVVPRLKENGKDGSGQAQLARGSGYSGKVSFARHGGLAPATTGPPEKRTLLIPSRTHTLGSPLTHVDTVQCFT